MMFSQKYKYCKKKTEALLVASKVAGIEVITEKMKDASYISTSECRKNYNIKTANLLYMLQILNI